MDDSARLGGRRALLRAAAGLLLGLAGVGAAVYLANGVRTCGNVGEACWGPGLEYIVLGVPAYLLGLISIVRVVVERAPRAILGWMAGTILVIAGLGGLYAMTFMWAAHT